MFLSNSNDFQLLEDGAVIFEADLDAFDLPDLHCDKRTAIVSYKDDVYKILASLNKPVPSGNGWVFGDDNYRFFSFSHWITKNDGSFVFGTKISSPRIPRGFTYRVEERFSIWSVSVSGEVTLIAVNGEEIDTPNGTITLVPPSSRGTIVDAPSIPNTVALSSSSLKKLSFT